MNAKRAEDVVTLQRLLEEARDAERRPALSVRVVQVTLPHRGESCKVKHCICVSYDMILVTNSVFIHCVLHVSVHDFPNRQMLCFVLDLQVSRIIDGDMDDSCDHELYAILPII